MRWNCQRCARCRQARYAGWACGPNISLAQPGEPGALPMPHTCRTLAPFMLTRCRWACTRSRRALVAEQRSFGWSPDLAAGAG